MSSLYAWDIETGPQPEHKLLDIMPSFSGRKWTKDPDKIEEQRAEKMAQWFRDAALKPETGMVMAIGIQGEGDQPSIVSHGEGDKTLADEKADIEAFFSLLEQHHKNDQSAAYVGYKTHEFDIPFICVRAVFHGIHIPHSFMSRGYAMAGKQFHDIHQIMSFGSYERKRQSVKGGLNTIAQGLGVGAKNGDGAYYAQLWKEDRWQADHYLENDLKMTLGIALKLRDAGMV